MIILKNRLRDMGFENSSGRWIRTMLLSSTAIAVLMACTDVMSAQAQTADCVEQQCDGGLDGLSAQEYPGAGTATTIPAGRNTEKSSETADPGAAGFSITFDDGPIAANPAPVAGQRKTDIDLSAVDIQVKFDGLGVNPTLNITTDDTRHSYQANQQIRFNASTNYQAWITRAELRIHDADFGVRSRPVQVVDASFVEPVVWRMPDEGPDKYLYVLRVYDAEGRYNETVPLGLQRTTRAFERHETVGEGEPVASGEGDDRTAISNIPVYGGAITVFGQNVPAGYQVRAIGKKVPVDPDGSFVRQQILPPGDHVVDVAVTDISGRAIDFERDVSIPRNEWFYVGLADLTVGRRIGSDKFIEASEGEFDRTYTKGRLAFYLKGKIKGRYILTAAADTQEDDIDNLFRNLDSKDPRQLLRRVDPDKYYPVYGDDSTAIEDAPTSGKFYVRLEGKRGHIMWGNYKTSMRNTELARNERALYGAHGRYKSARVTSAGEPRVEVEAYASQPGTLPQRDNLRGTGGSVYFLTRQDINRGSETVTIEIRDRVTGTILSRRVLRYGEDYEINYVQGVIILRRPLTSTGSSETIITPGSLGGNEQFLTAQYEYTPAVGDVDGYSFGGRAQVWLNDVVRVGASGISENTGTADQEITAVDVRLRLGENSYAEAEVARSRGPGFDTSNSINGGLTIDLDPTAGRRNRTAHAYRAKLHLDLQDLSLDLKGAVDAYFERKEEGFSSLGYNTAITQRSFGVQAKVELSAYTSFLLKYEDFKDARGQRKREGDAQLDVDLNEKWSVSIGVKHTHLGNVGLALRDGDRTDVGVKFTYSPDEDQSYYIFGQGTVHRGGNLRRNDRIGVGVEKRLTEKLGVSAELSYGTLGWGGLAAVTYDPTADDHYYIGYKLDPNRAYDSPYNLSGSDLGNLVIGTRRKLNDELSAYAENSYDIFGRRRSLTTTYGVVYTPTSKWTLDGALEYGDVEDPVGGQDLERVAVSASVGYKDEDALSWYLKGEARFEDSADPRKDRDTYLVKGGVSMKHNENWRLITAFDAAISNSDQTSILNGRFVEASIGYAYRPVDNDRLNALFKYSYLYDVPGPDQISVSGSILDPAQQSHILTADVSYDATQRLTLGAKYGFRIGEVSQTRGQDDFVASSAHLGIARVDYHVVKNWDILAEGRVLHTPELDTTDFGAVAAVYRHIGNNFKIGVGYNFGRFSDNVADIRQDDGGVFVNLVGKF